MKLGTIRTGRGTAAVRVDGDSAVETGHADVGALLAAGDWAAAASAASGTSHPLDTVDWAPLVPRPAKIVCVGLNYRNHILEMGRELPAYPTLFAKYSEALIGANDDIVLPAVSEAMDWEAELAVVIGAPVRRADAGTAARAIAGYSILNDVTARDWQNRTLQWLQGKTFESTTPFGPLLVTPDDPALPEGGLTLTARLDGELVQEASTADLLFDAPELISYISQILTLHPGDVISTGTPAGVGHGRTPPRYLVPGSELVTAISGLGLQRNLCVPEER